MEQFKVLIVQPPMITVFALLTVYFAVKFIIIAAGKWVPKHRQRTLTEEQIEGWKVMQCLLSLGGAVLWGGLALGAFIGVHGYWIAVAGLLVAIAAKFGMIRRFPYDEPETSKKNKADSSKKKKKK